jgi:hypothetical protein
MFSWTLKDWHKITAEMRTREMSFYLVE